jgi:signal transduction histidine kinase
VNSTSHRPSIFSIRLRLTSIAVVVVALVLGLSGLGVVYWQHRSMISQQETKVNAVTASVALALSENRPISSLVPPGTGVQIVDQQGNVVEASAAIDGQPPVSNLHPRIGRRETVRGNRINAPGDDGIEFVVAETVQTPKGVFTTYSMIFGGRIETSTKSLIIGLAIVLPLMAILLGILSWFFIGLALRPVDRMRKTVDGLAEDELDRRVPVPPGDDEIARLANTLNEMLERLDAAQRRQRSFISDASHELRSPIASLLATVEVARSHPDQTNWSSVAEVVLQEGRRLSRLVDDLLMLAATQEQGTIQRRETIDLDELLMAEATRVRLQGFLAVDTAHVSGARIEGDTVQVDRALRNIVDNAARHARHRLTFSVDVVDGLARVVIGDDGPGVSEDQAAVLFQRFTRADSARSRVVGGTGLGLAIVASVMHAHGGSVRFMPCEVGAQVELIFPTQGPPSSPSEVAGVDSSTSLLGLQPQ